MNSGINFGSILINGKGTNLKKYDANGDGKLNEDELKRLMEDFQLDTYNFKSVDKNNDREISPDEFTLWGQQMLMEEMLKEVINTRVSVEIIGKYAEYQQRIISDLRDFYEDFLKNPGVELGEMAEKFAQVLLVKYEEIKKEVLPSEE